MKILKALIKKETLQILRDPSSILIAIVLPLILIFIYGYGLNLDSNRVRLGFVVESESKESTELLSRFNYSKFLELKTSNTIKDFEEDISSGKIRGIVKIPANFAKDFLAANTQAKIQIITDGSEPNIASFVENYSRAIITSWLKEKSPDTNKEINIHARYWYNQELKSKNFLIPGSLAIIMTLVGTLLTALVIAREWERGTMEALMASPVSTLEILLSKFIPYYFLGISSMLICFLASTLIYSVPFRGSLLMLFISTSTFLFAGLSQGLVISIVGKSQFTASQMALMSAFLPAFMLSGFIFEIASMPKLIQLITYIFPARYFVSCLQSLFLSGDVYGILIPANLIMLSLGLILFFVMTRKFKKEII